MNLGLMGTDRIGKLNKYISPVILTHIIRKDLTKNASGQITDHYDLL